MFPRAQEYEFSTSLNLIELRKIDFYRSRRRNSCHVARWKALNSIVAGISTFGPIVSWLFRDISNPGNGLHILQTKFHGHQETERCSMIHGEGLTVEVCGEKRLWMAGRRQVDG